MSYGDYQDGDYRNKSLESSEPLNNQTVVSAGGYRSFINRVYNWMGAGLVLSGITAFILSRYMISTLPAIRAGAPRPLLWSPGFNLVLFIALLGIVFGLS